MMEPVPLILSCDTEDYETPASDDAELLWAQMFARHGIRASFCVVGEEARALGMPVFCDAPLEWAPGQPMWFAGGPLLDAGAGAATGSLGGLLLKYHTSFDRYFQVPAAERPARMRADFEALLASRQEDAQR